MPPHLPVYFGLNDWIRISGSKCDAAGLAGMFEQKRERCFHISLFGPPTDFKSELFISSKDIRVSPSLWLKVIKM